MDIEKAEGYDKCEKCNSNTTVSENGGSVEWECMSCGHKMIIDRV